MQRFFLRILPFVTAAWVLIELLSLRLGLLNDFFFGAMHADVQGIDYFSLPKAWLNLAAGRSAYDTFGPPTYGPHFTWYLSHPFLAAALGSWLSGFDPLSSYGVFTMFSLALMAASAWLLAAQSQDPLTRRLLWLLLLGAFPTYWMLWVGNPQAVLVLALTMLFVGFLRLADGEPGARLLVAGLLLSLLSKPVVLVMFPLLLLLRETRKPSSLALAFYAVVSALFEWVPFLNPEAIPLRQVLWEAVHPQWVRDHMNIYTNHLLVTPAMKDNSVHWFNLVAQAQTRLLHIDVFSLPVFLDQIFAVHMPNWLYTLPTIAALALSAGVWRIKPDAARMRAALLLLLALSLTFFLSYPTVWEYQYTAVLPVAAILLVLRKRDRPHSRFLGWMLALAACAWLPSLYFAVEGLPLTTAVLTVIRLDRVVPVTLLFLLLGIVVAKEIAGARHSATQTSTEQLPA